MLFESYSGAFFLLAGFFLQHKTMIVMIPSPTTGIKTAMKLISLGISLPL